VAGFFVGSPHDFRADAALGEDFQQQRPAELAGLTEEAAPCILTPMHHRREIQSLAMHRRIADLMKRDPEAVIGKALRNLHAWMARQQGTAPAVFQEWLDLLNRMSPLEIAVFIVSESEEAVRMRQSSPFAGVLSPREVWDIKRSHEAA